MNGEPYPGLGEYINILKHEEQHESNMTTAGQDCKVWSRSTETVT